MWLALALATGSLTWALLSHRLGGGGVGLALQDPLLLGGVAGPLGCTCSVVGWGCLPSWLMLGGPRSGHCPVRPRPHDFIGQRPGSVSGSWGWLSSCWGDDGG